ncbi:amidohydrolase [Rubritalea marina]|uniref:amidohydrolase n=1 Tax=Rubritalea marina TaxID=361055 RepID=UPI0003716FE8|nr:amidohydrolase [Rubritalea marina]
MKLIPVLLYLSCAISPASSLQDLALATESLPKATIYTAKEVITLDPSSPSANAVAVVGKRILATGTLEELKAAADGQAFQIDHSFQDQVIIPGLIAQHDHPFLTALTMETEVIAIEDWNLPSGLVPAARNALEYRQRIEEAEAKLSDPSEPLITWGYHHYFHGKLTRSDLDSLNAQRPIIVWHRSCHEFILNSAALKLMGIDKAYLAKQSESAQKQSNLAEGHFWEQGMFGIMPAIAPTLATPERINNGLKFMVDFFHRAGVTLGCEPGGILSKQLQDTQNAIMSSPDAPFRFYFIPDGKSIIAAHPDNAVAETEKIMDWGSGMTAMVPKQIKLFADGAIYSQLMQVKEPYTDGHEGEWMMNLDVFSKAFRTYWEAGYQLHIHVNGDAGLEMVLNTLEENMRRNPRHNHRTVIVHFAVSSRDQVDRIKRLGAIVSANPYYPVALADQYGKSGLGPERADPMTRMGDVERAGVSYSFHSDMPMAPGQPLFLMHCGVNRITPTGRVAAPEQRVSRLGALKAVTLDAAYSLQLEHEVGSIEAGKLANFTILAENPITCEPTAIKDIPIWGTVNEGRVLKIKAHPSATGKAKRSQVFGPVASHQSPYNHLDPLALGQAHRHMNSTGACSCAIGKKLVGILMAHSAKQ